MKYRIASIGELLWDIFPGGAEIGGAPGNFAYQVNALGGEGIVVSAVGNDEPGQRILDRFRAISLNTQYIAQDPAHPTGMVSVAVDNEGRPSYTIHENAAWDFIPRTPELAKLAENIDAICFGSLSQRAPVSRKTIRWLVKNAHREALRIFDINLRQSFYSRATIDFSLRAADVLKLNEEELKKVAEYLAMDGDELTLIKKIADKYDIRCIAYTRGLGGSLLLLDGEVSDHPGYRTNVVDAVGAGDAFTAALVMGMLQGKNLDVVNDAANRVASFVCSRRGSTPELPDELKKLFTSPGPLI
jgi:fructokinase